MNNTFNPQPIHFGIDYVRLVFPKGFTDPDLEKFFTGMSANSPYREIDWHGFHFVLDYGYSASKKTLKFTYNEFPIFYMAHYENYSAVGQNISFMIDIYSTAFYVPELRPFFSQFWRQLGFKGKVTRLDLALDLVCTPKEFLDADYVTQFPKGAMYGYDEKTGGCETRYFGEKASKNKRHLIRVYDKLKDSQDKQKLKLFGAYFKYENVIRVEVEIRSTTCKSLLITPLKLGDMDFLESVYRTLLINSSGTHFDALKNISLADAQKIKHDRDKVELPMRRLEISKRLLGMAHGLHTSGADPIKYLIDNFSKMGVYQDSKSLKRLQRAVHNAEVALNTSSPGFEK